MSALLHTHSSLIDYHNAIGIDHRSQTVSDDHSLFLHQVVDGILNMYFVFGIKRGSCLIEQNDGSIFQYGTGYGDALFLAAESVLPPSPTKVS